jgi:hypothetical protein
MTSPAWSLLIYAIASSDDELARIHTQLAAMRAALATEHCTIGVEICAASGTRRHWLSWSAAGGVAERAEDVAFADQPIQAMMTALLDAGNARAPAAATAFVVWAHGSGLGHMRRRETLELIGPGPVSAMYLTHVILEHAIRNSRQRSVAVLALNACWMATLEVAYGLRGVAEVQVASQVYAQAWPYGAIVTGLSARPAESAEDLARVIVAAVQTEIDHGHRHDAVSAVRSAALSEVVTALGSYATRVTALVDTRWSDVRAAVVRDAQRLDDPYQADLASLLGVLDRSDRDARLAADPVARHLREAIIASAAHPSHPGIHGLSILCPKSTQVDLDEAYDQTGLDKHSWAGFLRAFQRKAAAQLADSARAA